MYGSCGGAFQPRVSKYYMLKRLDAYLLLLFLFLSVILGVFIYHAAHTPMYNLLLRFHHLE
jgi:hypothetical protein